MKPESSACEENSVALLYKDIQVAETYILQRFHFSWSRLLHNKQVSEVNRIIREYQPASILEVAPGPARIATELEGVRHGVMIEYSQEMLTLARSRLEAAGCETLWEVQHGNAFDLAQLQRQFDFLFTFRFIRHFETEERSRLYQGMHACLKPGGIFMFDVVNRTIREKIDSDCQIPKEKLDVYDVTYSKQEFSCEMKEYGFSVLYLSPVVRHFFMQKWLSGTFDHRVKQFSSLMVNTLEKMPSRNPLEWIAVCRKEY